MNEPQMATVNEIKDVLMKYVASETDGAPVEGDFMLAAGLAIAAAAAMIDQAIPDERRARMTFSKTLKRFIPKPPGMRK